MSEPSYDDGEVVWVKWNNCWWPGVVHSEARIPKELITSLRKPVMVFVKFMQEDAFEFVRSHNNLLKYNCDKKLEFIKKGMDKYRTSKKMMSNFPGDVEKAEKLTNGNVDILKDFESPTKQKPGTPMATPEKSEASPATPSKKPVGAYNSASKVQLTATAEPKSDKKFSCTMCNYSTDRLNLLMFHIKNHSSTQRVSDPPPVVEVKKTVKSPQKIASDSIADDVRKIKESMKPKANKPSTSAKKTRQPVKSSPGRPRSAKKEVKDIVKEPVVKVEEKPKVVNELKNKLLADWSDDEDVEMEIKKEIVPAPKPSPIVEKAGESSRSIRNIPKKQRVVPTLVSEVHIPEPVKVEQLKVEVAKPEHAEDDKKISKVTDVEQAPKVADDVKKYPKVADELDVKKTTKIIEEVVNKKTIKIAELDIKKTPKVIEDSDAKKIPKVVDELESKRTQKGSKRKHAALEVVSQPKLPTETEADDNLLMETAELLNATEVPKVENAQLSSTFHILNDVDKRLPPKERNKRIMRDKEASVGNNGTNTTTKEEDSTIPNELMLPHKKRSRVLTPEKPVPQRESRSARQDTPVSDLRNRKKRKSMEPLEVESNSHEPPIADELTKKAQSPLRDDVENSISEPRRALKRPNSGDSQSAEKAEAPTESKRLHESDSDALPKTFVACASEALVINSKGQMSVARRDSLVTTQANTVMVTSHVILTEATAHQPIVTVSSEPSVEPKPTISTTIKIPQQTLKNAVKFPAEKLLEMKKQGLVTTGVDMKNKWTEKGKQIFKEQIKTAFDGSEEKAVKVTPEPERTKTPEPETAVVDEADPLEIAEQPIVSEDVKQTQDEAPADAIDECTNNNDVEKEPIVTSPAKETTQDEPVENGKETDMEPEVDANSGGAGLIALQAETFGGPPNCFYLCRQIGDRYEPVDNQILVLNAQNALVPYEGDISSEDALAPNDVAGYPQLSPNSNIIINTPNGQKIELDHYAILALQEQADENGIASIELSGEQLELNINGILEALSQQQEANENEALLPGALLLDGDAALILDTSELPETVMHHTATQVSETLSKPIMSTTIAPEISSIKATTIADSVSRNLNIEDSLASIGVTTQPTRSNVPKSLELPITVTNPTIAETVNHRKLANAPVLVPDSFVVQSVADNGSED